MGLFCETQSRRFYHTLSANAREKNVNKHTFNGCVYVYSVGQYTLLNQGHDRKKSQKMVILPLTYTRNSEIIHLLDRDTYAVYDNTFKRYDFMTDSKTVNYTDDMVAVLVAAAPIDYAKAQVLAVELDRGVRSIIAKCKREGIEYISKPAPAKKKPMPTKADTVEAIAQALNSDVSDLVGLEKATGQGLANLLAAIA